MVLAMFKKVIRNYIVVSILLLMILGVLEDPDFVLGTGFSLVVFGINFRLIIFSVDSMVNAYQIQGHAGITLISFLRFFFFMVFILLIFLAFGWVPVLIGNSISVGTILVTTLIHSIFSVNNNDKEQSNERTR